jgi:hypothetical protein
MVPSLLVVGGACEPPMGFDENDDDPSDAEEETCLLPAFPTASVTLDGEVGDWEGVEPLVLDAQGDDSSELNGDDLRGVFVAQSSDALFVLITLWEDVNANFGNGPIDEEWGRYEIDLKDVGPFPAMFIGIAFDTDGGVWSVGHNGASADTPDGLAGPAFVAVAGSVIEFGVPLNLIGNPSGFTEVAALSMTTEADTLDHVGQACIPG